MKSDRIQELDGLRGLAAMAVLLFHYSYGYQENYQFHQAQPFDFRLGYLGVPLFFIISGFVIFLTVDRTERPVDFVFSRFTRLYPTYWAGVMTTTAIVHVSQLPGVQRSTGEILVNLTMLQEFFGVAEVDGVYWTLTRELIFYGLVLAVFSLGLLRHVVPLAYAWLSLQCVANLVERHFGWFPWKVKFLLLTEYCHLFIAGIVFYRIFSGKASKGVYGLLCFAAFNQFILVDSSLPAHRLEEGCYILFFFLLMAAVVNRKASFLSASPLTFLGNISYALYLVHQYLGYAIIRHFDLSGWSLWTGIGLSIAASVAIGSIITWTIERPAISFLRNAYRTGALISSRKAR